MFVDGSREGSDRKIVEALMARDCFTRQAQLVVDWSESCAAHQRSMGDDNDKLEYFAGGSCAWTNTLHHVQSHNHIGSAPSSHRIHPAVGMRGKRHQEIAHIVQRGVVLGDADALIEEIHHWVIRQVDKTPLLTIGFLAHMARFLRQVGGETSTEAFSDLLRIYIHMLIDEGHVSFVATCAAALKVTDPVAKYKKLAQPPN
ncbi:hypothetical protein HPB51_028174 [Rhipicephalus microplus]|uniref:Nuclear pore complex protein n=1 Tax=Rhipicephalus microplus TaxID=6941 RepID=A0A9J6CXQ7_RHIMP|nr:hypothetical protein HPB51_028174 [Rhipicephalus microplus]